MKAWVRTFSWCLVVLSWLHNPRHKLGFSGVSSAATREKAETTKQAGGAQALPSDLRSVLGHDAHP